MTITDASPMFVLGAGTVLAIGFGAAAAVQSLWARRRPRQTGGRRSAAAGALNAEEARSVRGATRAPTTTTTQQTGV